MKKENEHSKQHRVEIRKTTEGDKVITMPHSAISNEDISLMFGALLNLIRQKMKQEATREMQSLVNASIKKQIQLSKEVERLKLEQNERKSQGKTDTKA